MAEKRHVSFNEIPSVYSISYEDRGNEHFLNAMMERMRVEEITDGIEGRINEQRAGDAPNFRYWTDPGEGTSEDFTILPYNDTRDDTILAPNEQMYQDFSYFNNPNIHLGDPGELIGTLSFMASDDESDFEPIDYADYSFGQPLEEDPDRYRHLSSEPPLFTLDDDEDFIIFKDDDDDSMS